jgi:hypothetical protein
METTMMATISAGTKNKAVAENEIQKSKQSGILDLGATSGAAPEEDMIDLKVTCKMSKKMFMFPDKQTSRTTKKMLLKHKIQEEAQEINIVPGLHSTLISVPKLADAGCTMVFSKTGAAVYDDTTTRVTANKPLVMEAPWCALTGLCKLNLDLEKEEKKDAEVDQATTDTINIIFDLPSAKQTFLWYHAAAGIPPKATFIKRYATETTQHGQSSR